MDAYCSNGSGRFNKGSAKAEAQDIRLLIKFG
jgi:hypothetical protein